MIHSTSPWTILLALLLALVVIAAGATTHDARNGRLPFRPLTFHRPSDTTSNNNNKDLEWQLHMLFTVRGGGGGGSVKSLGKHDDDEEEDGGAVVQKVRNVIRSLLQTTKGSPLLDGVLKSVVGMIQSLTGIDLLPKPEKSMSKKKKRVSVDKEKEEESSSSKKRSKTSSSSSSSSKKTKAPKKKASSEWETKDLKTTSPNYRIQRELKAFLKDPPPNLAVKVGKNLRVWIITMKGAKGTIYEGETFKLRVAFPAQYPDVPPSVYFLPPHIPLHEHVYTNGDICLSLLGKDWRPTMTAQSIAVSILSILSSAQSKSLPMDNARHAQNRPGKYQKDWVYHDDNC